MMKTTVCLPALAIALLCHLQLPAQVLDVAEAVKKGLLSVAAEGVGGHSGECLKLKLQNKSKKKLEVRVPAGQIFEASDSSLQNLMVAKEETFFVEAGKTWLGNLFGFCVEASDGSPGFMSLLEECRPEQATLVPDGDAQLTSDHGWDLVAQAQRLRPLIAR